MVTVKPGSWLLASCLLATTASTALAAQPVPEAEDNGSGSEVAAPIEQVVVTARRRVESTLDTPIAINSFSNQDILDIGARELNDFIELSPGVNFVSNGTAQSIAIRGVSTTLGGNANGYYLDNVPFTGVTTPNNPNIGTFDVERVEVLRGPQGTLFGEGSMGGTVRILTNAPDPGAFSVSGDAMGSTTKGGGGNYGVRGMVNVPLIEDKLAIRVVGIQEEMEGWIDQVDANGDVVEEDVNARNVTSVRGRVLFRPLENLTIEGSVWTRDWAVDAPDGAFDGGTTTQPPTNLTSTMDQYTGSIRYELNDLELRYAYGNTTYTEDFVIENIAFGAIAIDTTWKVETHEATASGTIGDRLDWIGGLYQRTGARDDAFDIPSVNVGQEAVSKSDAKAIFGEVEYSFLDWLSLAVGARYFDETFSLVETGVGFSGPIAFDVEEKFDSFNPRAILTLRPAEGHMVYLSAAKGFRGGQLQPSFAIQAAEQQDIDLPPGVQADSIWTYEIGAKSTILDDRLTLEAAAYFSDWKNAPISVAIVEGSLNGLSNIPNIENTGFEAMVTYAPVPALTLTTGLSLIDADVTSEVPGSNIMRGDPVPDVAKFSWNGVVTLDKPISDDLNMFAQARASHSARRRNTTLALNTPGDPITLVDLRVGLTRANAGLFLFADNLTNENGAINSRGVRGAARNRPRTLGVEARFTY